MNNNQRQQQHLIHYGKKYANVWKDLRDFRKKLLNTGTAEIKMPLNAKITPLFNDKWEKWCFLPTNWSMVRLMQVINPDKFVSDDEDLITEHKILNVLNTWRYTQGIYVFNEELYDSLTANPCDIDKIPNEVLARLPEWCIYVELKEIDIYGCYVCLDDFYDFDRGLRADTLHIIFDTDYGLDAYSIVFDVYFSEFDKTTILHAEGGTRLTNLTKKQLENIDDTVSILKQILALVLYLCAEEPDVTNYSSPDDYPKYPTPKKIKHGYELFPPDKPKLWNVGDQVSELIKNARTAREEHLQHNAPKPHIRRAHWHGYWTGKRNSSDRKFVLRWLPPIIVGVD